MQSVAEGCAHLLHHACQVDRVVSAMELEGIGSMDPARVNAALGLPPPFKNDAAGLSKCGCAGVGICVCVYAVVMSGGGAVLLRAQAQAQSSVCQQ